MDTEVRKLIDEQYNRAIDLLKSKRTELNALAAELLAKEVLFKDDLEKIIGPRPFDKVKTETVVEENIVQEEKAEDQAS